MLQLKKKKNAQDEARKLQVKIDNLQITLSKIRQQEEDRLTMSAMVCASHAMKDPLGEEYVVTPPPFIASLSS
jgi:hypothetical protein